MKLGRIFLAAAVSAVALGAAAAPAAATTFLALTGDRTILVIDREKKRVVRQFNVAVSGRLVGIDIRPADGQLYGVAANGDVVTINTSSGAVSKKSRLTIRLPASARGSVDFNPVVDRLRLVGSERTNLRANVDDGSVLEDTDIAYVQPNPFGGTTPSPLAVAYSNSKAGTKTTLLFHFDFPTKALYLQLPANDGTLQPVGEVMVNLARDVGFDIDLDSKGRNRGWLVSANRLWQIDLAGGAVVNVQPINGLRAAVRDVAVVPGS